MKESIVRSQCVAFIQKRPTQGMSLESKELIQDDYKIRSDGLLNALKQDKLVEARGYIPDIHNSLDSISDYLDTQIVYKEKVVQAAELDDPHDVAQSEAELAVLAAKRADEKAERLDLAAKDTSEEAKKLRKTASHAKREAKKAWKAAKNAEKSERRATKESRKAGEHADKANQAARRS